MYENLSAAIRYVHNGAKIRDAARTFGIPNITLQRRLENPFPRKPGGQTVFTSYEEDIFVIRCLTDTVR